MTASSRLGERASASAALPVAAAGAAVVAVLLAAFAVLEHQVASGTGVAVLDPLVLRTAVDLRSPALTDLELVVTRLGGRVLTPVLTVVVAVWLSARRRTWEPALLIGVVAGGSFLLTAVGDLAFDRARPPDALALPSPLPTESFPSGHALNAVAIAGVMAYVLLLRADRAPSRAVPAASAGLWAIAVGTSRLYLGQHWTTDVLAGWALGAAWLVGVVTAHRVVRARGVTRPVPAGPDQAIAARVPRSRAARAYGPPPCPSPDVKPCSPPAPPR